MSHSLAATRRILRKVDLMVKALSLAPSVLTRRNAIKRQFAECRPILRLTYHPLHSYGITSKAVKSRQEELKRKALEQAEALRRDRRDAKRLEKIAAAADARAAAAAVAAAAAAETTTIPAVSKSSVAPPKRSSTPPERVSAPKDVVDDEPVSLVPHTSIAKLFEDLRTRKLSGTAALDAFVRFIAPLNKPHQAIMFKILDRSLKIRCSVATINQAIPMTVPEFRVALARTFSIGLLSSGEGDWYVSRKIDGVRAVCFVQAGRVEFRTRTGRPISTELMERSGIVGEIVRVCGASGGADGIVLDGELWVAGDARDAADDFSAVASLIRRKFVKEEEREEEEGGEEAQTKRRKKNKTKKGTAKKESGEEMALVERSIGGLRFAVFDMLTPSEFEQAKSRRNLSTRLKALRQLLGGPEEEEEKAAAAGAQRKVTALGMERMKERSVGEVEQWLARADGLGWEGVMLRRDASYLGQRCSDLLKVKRFHDTELRVLRVQVGSMRKVNPETHLDEEHTGIMTNCVVDYGGIEVSVGSGFTFAQRVRFGRHPEQLVGKQITVQYFAESVTRGPNDERIVSLRFPTVKYVYSDNDRNE